MIAQLSAFIIHLIQSSGYFGIFLLMTLESALLPIPSEVIMPFGGFMVHQGLLNFWGVVFVGALGNLVGSLIAYAVGYFLEEKIIIALIKKYGKFILLSEHEYTRAMQWFAKYGAGVTFFSRILPAVRTFISLPAGLSEMKLWKFSLYTFVGSFIWSAFLTWMGVYLGNHWNAWEPYFRKFQIVILVLLLVGVVWYINHKLHIIGKKK